MNRHFSFTTRVSAMVLLLAGGVIADNSKIPQSEVRLEPIVAEPVAHDQFGSVVAASANGNTLAVAGITADDGNISEVGAIFIFDRVDNQWVQTARLFPSDPIEDETLGFDMALSEDGNTVVAGEVIHDGLFHHQGAVYVFQRVNGTWVQQAELLSPTPGNNELFGTWGVGISGDTLVAGDLGGPTNGFIPGVDVFTRANGKWSLSTIIQLPDDFDFSPSTVAVRGNTIAVGNIGANSSAGAVWVFGLANGMWTLQAKLSPSDVTGAAQFGVTVAIDGNTLAVGALSAPGVTSFSGAVYVFNRRGSKWVQTATVTAADGVPGDSFGVGLDVSGETLAVGAPTHTTSVGFAAGAVYLFKLSDGQWNQFAEFTGSDVAAGGDFGGAVALKNGTLLVGASLQHPQPNNVPYPEGEAYVYKVN